MAVDAPGNPGEKCAYHEGNDFILGGVHAHGFSGDFIYVSGRWANPFWRVYDFAMLTLALLHGGNGLRVIIDDYARTAYRRLVYLSLAATVVGLTWVLGSLTIFAFTPRG